MQAIARSACVVIAALLLSCELPPDRVASGHGEMFDEVAAWVWANGYEDGDWEPDWDDSVFYGPAFYASWGWDTGDPALQQRAAEARDHNLAIAEEGLDDLLGVFLENASAILYGTLGAIEYMHASGDMSGLETVDEVIENAGSMLQLMGDYVNTSFFHNYATDTYGPTSITAIFTLLYLQHAVLLHTDRADEYIERARQILDTTEERVWNGHYYLFAPDRPDYLDLYPNVAMMIALVRMYQATGEDEYLDRAEGIYQEIQALKCEDRPGYRSLYSAETMGAQTDDYSTLSAMNYTMLAMALLAQETGQQVYRDEVDELLGFVRDYLWLRGEGQVIHHWMDGRRAVPEDPEYYCIGCNLQLLYIIWWVDTFLGA
jgi:hypothetical protein